MARPRQLEIELNKLNEVVEHALLLADADLKANLTEIEKELAPDLPPALFDRRRLLQALLNTLRNGAQSMPHGGVLHVATRLRRKGENEFFEIEVRDHGVGIPPRAMKQVFDPFFSTKISGSGLGLAVTLRIVRDHGGDIDVFSDEGRGTTFIMSLPVHRAPSEHDSRGEGEKDSTAETEIAAGVS
jgi:signal transduction histidine kinase